MDEGSFLEKCSVKRWSAEGLQIGDGMGWDELYSAKG